MRNLFLGHRPIETAMYRKYEDMPKIKLPFGNDVYISDSTIRDGIQMPGIVMGKPEKLRVFEYLHRIGIEKLETFVFSDVDKQAVREMLDFGYELPEVTAWARARKEDIDEVLKLDGVKETGILTSVSDTHLFDKIGFKSREEAEKSYLKAVQYALDHGLKVRAHLEDMTRSDLEGFTLPFVEKLLELDKDMIIRVCDTVSYGVPFPDAELPYSLPKILTRLREMGAKNIEMHVHDDFGEGVTNSLTGYWYGANWVNLTFLGIGERAGNSELEKVLIFLKWRVEGFEKYDLKCLTEFAEYMEHEVGIRVPRNKAVVGRNVFAHESGIHTAGVIKHPFTYEPYPPEIVGGKRMLMVGSTSGRDIIKLKIEEALEELMHLEVKVEKKDHRIAEIQKDIKKLYEKGARRSSISDEEMKTFAEKYFIFEHILEKDKTHREEEENED